MSELDARGQLVNGVVQFSADGDFVYFEKGTKHMEAKSAEAGRAVWEPVDFLIVHHAGERDPIKRYATAADAMRWPKQWEAYQQGQTIVPDGTDIAVLFPTQPDTVKNLQSLGIQKIEQLALMADSAISSIPFGGTLKERAKKFLDAQNDASTFNRLEAQLDREKAKTSQLEAQVKEMGDQLRELSARGQESVATGGMTPEMLATIQQMIENAAPKRGPGRPPKQEN